jgi:hypothetical protein
MINPTSRPDVKSIAMKVNKETGVTPITFTFHHLITQNTTSPNAKSIPKDIIIVNIPAILASPNFSNKMRCQLSLPANQID